MTRNRPSAGFRGDGLDVSGGSGGTGGMPQTALVGTHGNLGESTEIVGKLWEGGFKIGQNGGCYTGKTRVR